MHCAFSLTGDFGLDPQGQSACPTVLTRVPLLACPAVPSNGWLRITLPLVLIVLIAAPLAADDEPAPLPPVTLAAYADILKAAWPTTTAAFVTIEPANVTEACHQLERAAEAQRSFARQLPTPQLLQAIRDLNHAYVVTEGVFEQALRQRHALVSELSGDEQTAALQHLLQMGAQLTDTSGRLQEHLEQTINAAAFRSAPNPALRDQLVDLLLAEKIACGASIMSVVLLDPLPNSPNKAQPASKATKLKILKLITTTGRVEALQDVADWLLSEEAPPDLAIDAAETIVALGLPQTPRAGQDRSIPDVEIAPAELNEYLLKLPKHLLTPDQKRRCDALIRTTALQTRDGLPSGKIRVGKHELQAGDWLLIRNPSPYNLFTNLSPGWFTHVGVITTEKGKDGSQRLVVVEMVERGARIPATNVEAYLKRTLHWVALRHKDSAVAKQMAQAAHDVIGNECIFDLTFRTARVEALKGQTLVGKKIHTYCAGLLLLCAQTTGHPRTEFFPVAERPATALTVPNIEKLGMSIGADFISPTGALFGSTMELVARRPAYYEPNRQVEEAIFDEFAKLLVSRPVVPSADAYQALRIRMAKAAQGNPLLARAMTAAADVHADTDLVAGAQAAAVIETLDEIAYGQSRQFRQARRALGADPRVPLEKLNLTPAERTQWAQLRQEHSSVWQAWQKGELTPVALREQLVEIYSRRGQQAVFSRFFAPQGEKVGGTP